MKEKIYPTLFISLLILVILTAYQWTPELFDSPSVDNDYVQDWLNWTRLVLWITIGLLVTGFFIGRLLEWSRLSKLKSRRVDAVMPAKAEIGDSIFLRIQVRFYNSPHLGSDKKVSKLKGIVEKESEFVDLKFPPDPVTGKLLPARILAVVKAPDFTIEGPDRQTIEIPPFRFSKCVTFMLNAKKAGNRIVEVIIYDIDAKCLGTIPLESAIGTSSNAAQAIGSINLTVNIQNISLDVRSPGDLKIAGPSNLQQLIKEKLSNLGVDIGPVSVFDQSLQEVQTQTNVAGDFIIQQVVYDQSDACDAGEAMNTQPTSDDQQVVYDQSDACDPADALPCYLAHVIDDNARLQLQGIRSASGLVSIALEEVYITLTATVRKTVTDEEAWIEEMAGLAPGEAKRRGFDRPRESVQQVKVQVQEALALHPRLVVLGDPGCGKTTLLRYLALTYARDFAAAAETGNGKWVKERLGLDERRLPVLLPLRDFARYLERECPNVGADGPKLLLDYLRTYFANQNITLPPDFFEARLKVGECAVCFDGVDEVASMSTRQRVARILERFTLAYPANRYVVTSRIVGYTGGARLGADYAVTTVRDFTDADIARFARHWNRAVEVVLAGGETAYALRKAEQEAVKLITAIQNNARVRELAVNPLLLTVIALVQRYRAQLPDRRVELYEEAIEVLLVQWDAVKGLPDIEVLQGLELDAGDRRSMLEPVALWLMEQRWREIEVDDLRKQLAPPFHVMLKDERLTAKAVDGFIALINARSGLLTERGQGIYAFSHLTFQEHLAARAVADRPDNVDYTLARLGDSWWREVILLEAGYLSTQGKRRATELIRALMEHTKEPEPYHNLVLAAEAARDVSQARTAGDLAGEIQARLRQAFATPLRKGGDLAAQVQRRAAAAEALGKIESGGYGAQPAFWTLPYGEPMWVEIPAGEFWMGSYQGDNNEKPIHKVHLERYWIAKTPITNVQYRLFVEATGHRVPEHWENSKIPRGLESHPVVFVAWHDAIAYCQWLSEVTGKAITLLSEAEWEKAARGNQDQREYPWGNSWKEGHCNSEELSVNDTTPVGIFPEGASPYGCLDMVGNVWEWTRSHWKGYRYNLLDGREDLNAGDFFLRVLRGGAFYGDHHYARCAARNGHGPSGRDGGYGFRVVVAPSRP